MSGPPIDDIKVTPEEYNRLKDAMKEPEFRKLLSDYMEEISDPKNKAEYDEYLKQLEKERELPKNMKLVEPKPCFCLKTKIKAKNTAKTFQKLFINICSAADVERPNQNKKESQKGKGVAWSVPYSASKIRYDQDKHKAVCSVIDVVFHPLAFEFARKSEPFKNMVCEIALEAANKQIRDENDMASKDFKILKKTTCKGGKPALLPMKIDQKFTSEGNRPPKQERNEDQGPKLYQEFMKQQASHTVNQLQEKARNSHIVELASHDFEVADETGKKEDEEDVKAIARPKYTFTYVQDFEMGSFIAQGLTEENAKYKNLQIMINLPRAEGIKEVDLDVSQKNLILKVPGKYYLDVVLPVRVKEEEGNAKFETKTKTLKITLPIIPEDRHLPQKPQQVEELQSSENAQDQSNKPEQANGSQAKKPVEAAESDIAVKEADINPEDLVDGAKQGEEEDGPQFGDKSSLKFVTEESQKKYLEEREKMIAKIGEDNSGKVLVQELEPSEVKQTPKKEEEQKKVINLAKDFKTQETQGNYFFIFNVANYNKEGVKIGFLETEVLFSYVDEKREYKTWIQLDRKYDIKGTVANFVVDYIVLNLKKLEPTFWEKSCYSVKEYSSDFDLKLTSYEDSLKLVENAQEAKTSDKSRNEEGSAQKDEEDAQSNAGADDSKLDDENKSVAGDEKGDEKFSDKRSINFINYNRKTFVFQLD